MRSPSQWAIRHQFEFSSVLQRMSVLAVQLADYNEPARELTADAVDQLTDSDANKPVIMAFVKGSPEAIATLCLPSTLPDDYNEQLERLAHEGYRIIAYASKRMSTIPKVDKAELRELVERDLCFGGFVVLENKLKARSAPTLSVLRDACVRCIMVTGDNPLTAVSVSKSCGLFPSDTQCFISRVNADQTIDWVNFDDSNVMLNRDTMEPPAELRGRKYELAVTGPAFRLLKSQHDAVNGNAVSVAVEPASAADKPTYGTLFQRVVMSSLVFARMTPAQKAELVTELQALKLYTGMIGDGANDCAALKAAHVGISLSDSEASIAAPFTAQVTDISCVPVLLSEGRASLITSYQMFRYMVRMFVFVQLLLILSSQTGHVLDDSIYRCHYHLLQ